MTLTEMQICAADTLSFFLEVMPDAPFSKDDIIFEFASRKDMAERAKVLCAQYCPDKIINDSQSHQLNEYVAANALIGRRKSAVIAWRDHRLDKKDWRRIIFHELVHIYCAKMEMDGEHFIDIYGSGHTYDTVPENEISTERSMPGMWFGQSSSHTITPSNIPRGRIALSRPAITLTGCLRKSTPPISWGAKVSVK